MIVRTMSIDINGNKKKIGALHRYTTSFQYLGNLYFIFFCIVYVVKYIRNNLIYAGNYFKYPSLNLSDRYSIPVGICNIKIIQ